MVWLCVTRASLVRLKHHLKLILAMAHEQHSHFGAFCWVSDMAGLDLGESRSLFIIASKAIFLFCQHTVML